VTGHCFGTYLRNDATIEKYIIRKVIFITFVPRALSINVASPATLPRNGYVNGTIGNVIELVDHIHHTPTQNDVFEICNIKKFRFS
jgi:hypothetical protein